MALEVPTWVGIIPKTMLAYVGFWGRTYSKDNEAKSRRPRPSPSILVYVILDGFLSGVAKNEMQRDVMVATIAASTSPGSMNRHCSSARLAHTPARQSACNSTRT
jgi:hypothetical protein